MMLGPGAIIVVSMASTTPVTEIRRPNELVSVVSAKQNAAMLPPVMEPMWLREPQNRLTELGRLPDNWGGSEKPSERACDVALSLIKRMERHGHRYLRIAPMADGGLSIRYLEGERNARFDIYNDEDEIVVVTREGRDARPVYKELPESDAVDELSLFLQNGDAASAG
jgi:hypothetical protein